MRILYGTKDLPYVGFVVVVIFSLSPPLSNVLLFKCRQRIIPWRIKYIGPVASCLQLAREERKEYIALCLSF